MPEYFITARSFAAPIVSDESTSYITAESPRAALLAFEGQYSHSAGLYAAEAWENADAYHKQDVKPLLCWHSNLAQARIAGTDQQGVENPREGVLVP